MRPAMLPAILAFAAALCAQDGQHGSRPGWPCAGRALDPSYLETSESTGGQVFLFQPKEAAHASVAMGASFTHPATILRAIGNASGALEFEFPVDSTVKSVLVLASLQCREAIRVSRPGGEEMTATNSAQRIDLQAGVIERVDSPEPGTWKVQLKGTGLFILSVMAKADVALKAVSFTALTGDARASRLPLPGVRQKLEARVAGEASNVRFQIVNAAGDPVSDLDTPEPGDGGAYTVMITPPAGRFRIRVTGSDAMGRPFQRTHPVLFGAQLPK